MTDAKQPRGVGNEQPAFEDAIALALTPSEIMALIPNRRFGSGTTLHATSVNPELVVEAHSVRNERSGYECRLTTEEWSEEDNDEPSTRYCVELQVGPDIVVAEWEHAINEGNAQDAYNYRSARMTFSIWSALIGKRVSSDPDFPPVQG